MFYLLLCIVYKVLSYNPYYISLSICISIRVYNTFPNTQECTIYFLMTHFIGYLR